MKDKPILCPERLRHVPAQFSWVDQRLVRHGHITRCSPAAAALYLLLLTVADARGLSYYSDASAGRLLSLSGAQLRQARAQLLGAGLIAYEAPFYQVLSLDPQHQPRHPARAGTHGNALPAEDGAAAPPPLPRAERRRGGEARSLGEVLRQIMEDPPAQP